MEDRHPSASSAKILASNRNPTGMSRLERLEILAQGAQATGFGDMPSPQMPADQSSMAEAYYRESENDFARFDATSGYSMQRTTLYGNNVDSGQYQTRTYYSKPGPSASEQSGATPRIPDHMLSSPIRFDLAVFSHNFRK